MAISEECQTGRCNECPKILANGEKCEHGCSGHINTAPVHLDETLRQQLVEQGKIDPITPNEPHIA